MPLPRILNRSSSAISRYARLSPPASPRVVASQPQIGNPEIGNLEDAVGALERWWATSDRGKGGEREGGRWRAWVARAPLIVAFSILGLTYVPFVVWVGHDQLYLIHGQVWRYIVLLLVYHSLLFLTALSLYRASTIPPGSPHPTYAHPSREGKEIDEGVEDDDLPLSVLKNPPSPPRHPGVPAYPPPTPPPTTTSRSSPLPEAGRADRMLRRWCRECQGWKPPRCHHCRTCGVCVLRMDHHCIWLNTCIGYANHKAFLLFLGYATLLSGLVVEETGWVIYKWLDGGQVVDITDFRPVANLMLFVVAVTFLLSIGSFACFHIYLATNNRTTLENMRPSLPPAAMIESGSTTPLSPTAGTISAHPPSPEPMAFAPPPAYSPRKARKILGESPANGSRTDRIQHLQHPSSPRSPRGGLPDSTATTGYHWQWRWKPDHLLSRNERKLVRHVADNCNIYDRGDGWRNLGSLFGDDAGGEDEGQWGAEGDVESGLGGRRRIDGGRKRDVTVWLGRAAGWLWPTAIQSPRTSSSVPSYALPGHSFPISATTIETIRYKTYGLRTRRRIAIRPRARNPDHVSEEEDGLVRSSNEFEFDSEEGYEVDEMEEYGMI